MVCRRECPPHVLLPNTSGHEHLKFIIKYFGLDYDPQCVYTRCTLCNGQLRALDENEMKLSPGVPSGLKSGIDENGKELTFYECVECSQVYWWGGKTQKEAEKFMKIFDDLEIEEKEIDSKDEDEHIPPLQVCVKKELFLCGNSS